MCRAEGRVKAARIADHVEDHKGDPVKFWQGELQSLCTSHHNQKTRLDDAARRSGRARIWRGATVSGQPSDPNHPWNLPAMNGAKKALKRLEAKAAG
jgi:hypothetical protein